MKYKYLTILLLSVGSLVLTGCSSTEGSVATGAAIGAAGGWALGNSVGGSEAGYLGAVAGGVAGAGVGFFSADDDEEPSRNRSNQKPKRPKRSR
jgi:uncharacterized protein YcfJ